MNYDDCILKVLVEAGERGLTVVKISRHVYNASNSLFNTVDFNELHRYVQQFLLKNSKSSDSMIESTGTRGIYRLNPQSKESQQLMLQFQEEEVQEDEDQESREDQSLFLF